MHTLTESDFLSWAETNGISHHPSYAKVAILSFAPGVEDSRIWEVPPHPERRPFFLASALTLMGDWKLCYVWRHSGSWPDPRHIDPRRVNDGVEYQILSGLGLPMGSADVVAFSSADIASLVTLLFSTTVFGWSVGEDLCIVPDNAKVIIQTDHHNVLRVKFRAPADVPRAVLHMADAGFPLPEDVPDEVLKPRAWLKGDKA